MYAVVEIQGHQYIIKSWDEILVDRVKASVDESVTFDGVLMTFAEDQSSVSLGQPYVKGAKVVARVVSHDLGDKIRVLKFQSKKRHQRVKWFRAQQSVLHIETVSV